MCFEGGYDFIACMLLNISENIITLIGILLKKNNQKLLSRSPKCKKVKYISLTYVIKYKSTSFYLFNRQK